VHGKKNERERYRLYALRSLYGLLGKSCQNFIKAGNSCCVPRFPLIASCYKIVDSKTSIDCWLLQSCSFTLLRSRSRKCWKGRSRCWSRTFYLRVRIPGVASRISLANLCWEILDAWPKQGSWDRSIRRWDSTFSALRI